MLIRTRLAYGPHRSQFGKLMLTRDAAAAEHIPVVVLVHGGYWHDDYSLTLENAVARSLMSAGALVWNVEYRRLGADGGGWPDTGRDVVGALELLAEEIPAALPGAVAARLDLDNVTVIGHSAGAQLAIWAVAQIAARIRAAGRVSTVIAQAGVLDLVAAGQAGRRSTRELLGVAYDDDPERYRLASPAHQTPFDARVVAIHGRDDVNVYPEVSIAYVEAARAAGQSAELVLIDGEAHNAFLDPHTQSHRATMRAAGLIADDDLVEPAQGHS